MYEKSIPRKVCFSIKVLSLIIVIPNPKLDPKLVPKETACVLGAFSIPVHCGKSDFDYCKLKGIDDTIANKRKESFEKVKENESVEWIDELLSDAGDLKYMLRILHPLENSDKYILTGYDITDLKKAEQEKQQYINDLEQMMFMTSHKVRHPISQLIGISNLLEEELSKEEVTGIISYIKNSILSLETFTRELTMFIHESKNKNEKRNL